jgi:tripartite-type tricarboxylate transporter receptor subunit TctC
MKLPRRHFLHLTAGVATFPALSRVVADPKSQARFTELGASTLPGSPADFGRLLADETEKWGKVVKFAGITPV